MNAGACSVSKVTPPDVAVGVKGVLTCKYTGLSPRRVRVGVGPGEWSLGLGVSGGWGVWMFARVGRFPGMSDLEELTNPQGPPPTCLLSPHTIGGSADF